MRILVQWTRANPLGWESIGSTAWKDTPKKVEPDGSEIITDTPGWVFGLCVQGHGIQSFDHYHVRHIAADHIVVTGWNDDPVDYSDGWKWAIVYDFTPYRLDGDRYNTTYSMIVYAEDLEAPRWNLPASRRTLRRWDQFTRPAAAQTRHGIWTTPTLAARHEAARDQAPWIDWTDGVPIEYQRDGKVR